MKLTDKITNFMTVNQIRSLAEFARLARLPYMTVNNLFVKDYNNTKIETLIKLKNAMGISLDDLVDDNVDINFEVIKNIDYIKGNIDIADNTVISIGRGGKRLIYTITDEDAAIVNTLLERLNKKNE